MTTTITQAARDIAAQAYSETDYPYKSHLELITNSDGKDLVWPVIAVQRALDAPRAPMTEDEMLQRARRAAIDPHNTHRPSDEKFLRGDCDKVLSVQAALRALRDLDKSAVDPDVLAVREIAAEHAESLGLPDIADEWRTGVHDSTVAGGYALAVYRAAR